MVVGGEVVGTDDGKVFAFGLNDCGQLAQPSTVPFSQVSPRIHCRRIASGSALSVMHRVIRFIQIPLIVAGLPPITSVAAGHHHSAAISGANRGKDDQMHCTCGHVLC